MNIIFKKLTSKKIEILNRQNGLYILDFRATGEALNYEIPAMWKYENLLTHILNKQTVVVNEDYKELDIVNENNYLVALKAPSKPSKPVISRVDLNKISDKQSIINLIPHPEFDDFGKEHNVNIFFSFNEFVRLNNKVEQKKLLEKLTPEWYLLEKVDDERIKTHYVKASVGSGGYKVFSPGTFDKRLFNDSSWYVEEKCEGQPMSTQILKQGSEYFVFGVTEQKIEESKYFMGGEVINFDDNLNSDLKNFLEDAIERLNKLLKEYEGFLGIDFVRISDSKYSFLEANIRLTAMTIPTLVVNQRFERNTGLFLEDVSEPKGGDFIMSVNKSDNVFDILREIK